MSSSTLTQNSNDTYRPPTADLRRGARGQFPGITRSVYWGSSIGLTVLAAVFAFGAVGLLSMDSATGALILGVGYLALVAVGFWLLVERLRNTGWSGWMALLCLIPLVNLYVWLRASAFPTGYSEHGQLDGPAWAISALLLGLVALNVLVSFAAA